MGRYVTLRYFHWRNRFQMNWFSVLCENLLEEKIVPFRSSQPELILWASPRDGWGQSCLETFPKTLKKLPSLFHSKISTEIHEINSQKLHQNKLCMEKIHIKSALKVISGDESDLHNFSFFDVLYKENF